MTFLDCNCKNLIHQYSWLMKAISYGENESDGKKHQNRAFKTAFKQLVLFMFEKRKSLDILR